MNLVVEQRIQEIKELLKGLPEDKINDILAWVIKDTKLSSEWVVNWTREEKINEILERIKRSESKYELLRFLWWKETMWLWFDLYRTFLSIWIKDDSLNSSDDLEDLEPESDNNIKNHKTNYKIWLGKKLFLSKKEIDEKSIEDIDNSSIPYINAAINHIERYLNNFSGETKELLKSQYYSQIHNWDWKKTVFSLIKFFYKLKKREANLRQEMKSQKRVWINYENALEEIKMWIFEIQRILAIAMLYIDREKNQNFQHTLEDTDFIIKKLEKIVTWDILTDGNLWNENPLYHMTSTWYYEWSIWENWYIFAQIKRWKWNPKRSVIFDSLTLKWRERQYKSNESEVRLVHIASRMKKWSYSAVDKFIRKGLSTFNQILDHKWFIMVVDNFDEWKRLLRILENELWTVETSWIEEPEFMSDWGNKNTNGSYNSLKAVLKVPYKWKLIRDFYSSIESVLKSNSKLRIKMAQMKKEWKDIFGTSDFMELERLFDEESSSNEELKKIFSWLKDKFWRKEYNIEIEIQIFDTKNYFKAEIDESSPAHHIHYKKRQVLDWLWFYFPNEVYWDSRLIRAISDVVE